MKPYAPHTLPIKKIDWERLVPLIAKANSSLARFDAILNSIPSPMLLLAPIMTQEAVLSSRIEGTQATLVEVLEYEAEKNDTLSNLEDVHEVENYRAALLHAIKALKKKPITLNLIKEMHNILLRGVRGNNKKRGAFRTTQNWIGRSGCSIAKATFVPPSPIDLPSHLSQLEKYLHLEDKEQLVQLALIHAQFELLHPFLDGNGRIGRLLVPLFLFEKNLISHPSFYISAYFEENRDAYYDHLEDLSSHNRWNDWIAFFLEGIIEQANSQLTIATSILELYDDMEEFIAECTKSHHVIKVLHFLFAHPIFKTTRFIEKTGLSRTTANRMINQLVKSQVLKEMRTTRGRAGKIYRFDDLLKVLIEAGN